jgi:hypothetical protein
MSFYKPVSVDRYDILRARALYGVWYGATVGIAFAVFAWGIDAYQLSAANSLHPWLKFVGGLVPAMLLGALAGWLTSRLDKPMYSVAIWGVAGLAFAWLTVNLPLQIAPRLIEAAEPGIAGLLHYEYYPEFSSRITVAFIWIAIFIFMVGLLQLPLSDTGVFSVSLMGKLSPILVAVVLMGICGTIIDGLNNELLRGPVQSMDASIQFYVDNLGRDIPAKEAREMHLGSLRAIKDLVTPDRKLIVSGYNERLEEVNVLVHFEDAWVECRVFYNQPINCVPVSGMP